MLDKTKPLVVIYHGGSCRDGFCSAFLMHRAFPNAEFVPANYGDAPPDVSGKQVAIVDFSYPVETLRNMQNDCIGNLVILDHHKTAQPILAEFVHRCLQERLGDPVAVYDVSKSGAMLTWEFLIGHNLFDIFDVIPEWKEPPVLVKYVQDRDLWKWELPDSKLVNEGIRLAKLEFDEWNTLLMQCEHVLDNIINNGRIVTIRNQAIIDSHVKHAVIVELEGYEVPMVNCTVDLTSEVCSALAVGKPFAISYFDSGDGKRVYSLRSDANGVDVSVIAKMHMGGGHKHAAGFTVELPKHQPWLQA